MLPAVSLTGIVAIPGAATATDGFKSFNLLELVADAEDPVTEPVSVPTRFAPV